MNSRDVWIPYLVTHVLTLLLIFICYKWPKVGKAVWGFAFMAAGIFNIFTVLSGPEKYVDVYGQHAIPLYKKFIYGFFSSHTILFVVLIAAGQILVGLFLFMKKTPLEWGVLGGIFFLIAISPLGIGSAFPSTLLMALSLFLMHTRYKKLVQT